MSETLLKKITLEVIEPLCDESKKLFAPLRIESSDRVHLSTHKDGRHYIADFFSFRRHWKTDDIVRAGGSYAAAVRFPQRIPERRKYSENKWMFGAADLTTLLFNFHWTNEQISFADDYTRNAYKYSLINFIKQTHQVKNRDDLTFFDPLDHEEFPLSSYQKKALKASMNTEGFGLFMEQGTGKTAVVISRICNEAKKLPDGQVYRAIVVCPNNVRANWESEIAKFATVPGRVTIIRGDKLNRYKCILEGIRKPRNCSNEKFQVLIISYDSVEPTYDPLALVNWDLCILDESHYIKNQNTKRWKALKDLRDRCKQRMVLTGTPITNTMLDLYTQFEFMGDNWSGFSSYNAFKKFYGQYAKTNPNDQRSYQKLIGLTNVPMIQERLARQAYLIKKSVALPDLPQKTYDIHEVEMIGDQKETYTKVCAEIAVEIENELSAAENPVLIVNNMLTKMLRLAQITSGFVGISEQFDEAGELVQEAVVNRFDPNPKVDALVEILKVKEKHQKTIIWACFVQDIKTIAARLRLEGIDCVTYYGATSEYERSEAVRRFNCDPDCTVFIGNAAAGGTGINLLGYDLSKDYNGNQPITYCDHVIYFSQNWSSTNRSQSEDRAHRRGTVTHVQYTDLMIPSTIDHEIRARVVDKRRHALKIQDIRRILTSIKES